jgi:tetratricopeptide (TPR) repeat protein
MRDEMMRLCVVLILSCLLLVNVSHAGKKKTLPPAGMDSTTKREADSLSKALFGDVEDEQDARKVFENGQEDYHTGDRFLTEADSLRRFGIDTALSKPRGIIGMIRQDLGDTSLSSGELQTRKRATYALKRAAREFERALEIAPDMVEARLWLAAACDRLKDWARSAAAYREVLTVRKGEDRLWFNYGYACLQSKRYDQAVTGFEQAIQVAFFANEDSTKIPNRYRMFAGEAFLRTYQDQAALERFRQALRSADSSDAAEIKRTIEWIEWDNGGIRTAELRDSALVAEKSERWDVARQSYLLALQAARTKPAKEDLSYRLALLEYQHGSRSDGLSRMKSLVEGSPEAPLEQRENYGKMLFSYAQAVEKDGDARTALGYYLQCTKFAWSSQGAGFVEIARIAANDLDRAIDQATKALTFPLTRDQQQAAYRILADAYRAKGDWDNMKRYRALMETNP